MCANKEPEFCHSTLLSNHDSKPFEYNGSSFDTAEPKSTMKENHNGIFCHLNGHGRNVDPLAPEMNDKHGYWNTPELEYSVVVDDLSTSNENEVKDSAAPSTVHNELSEKDSDLYTDKNVMACGLPELIVCYKESTYHVVKDICVDKGVPSGNKILTENVMVDRTSLPSNGNKHHDMTKEVINTDFLFQDGLRSSSLKDCDEDTANECATEGDVDIDLLIPDGQNSSSEDDIDQDTAYECGADELKSSSESDNDQVATSHCGSGDLIQTSEEKCSATEKITDDAWTEELVSNSMSLAKEFRKETSLKFLLESSKYGDNDVGQKYNQISCVQAISEGADVVSIAEESNKSCFVDNLLYNSKVESGTITFNFDSSKLSASTRDESPENIHEQELKSENLPIHDDGISDDLEVTSKVQLGGGESSLSVAGPLSDVVMYSGPIPFSGSISLRSDSSTTSTRSFAFPILQAEWNSSPARMAKADRMHFRKQRGWRQGLLCCRF